MSLTAYSQETSMDSLDNSIGLKASNISGYGFYYNRRISDDYKLQVMGLIYYYYNEANKEIHKIFNYDIGLELQRDIYRSSNFRTFMLAGAYYYFDDDHLDGVINDNITTKHSYNVGVGLAGEYMFRRFLISFDLGYKFFEDRLEIKENANAPYPELKRVTKVGAGIGIGFMF
jgi:hypothetical protein